jgi:hypothetical protein
MELEDAAGDVNEYIVNGSFVAAAVAAIAVDPDFDVATPLTRKPISGFKRLLEEADEYLGSERKTLREAGCFVIYKSGDNYLVDHGISTNVTSVNTREITITTELDVAALAYVNALDSQVIGSKLTAATINTIKGIIRGVALALIDDEILAAIGDIDVTQSETQPDTVNVVVPTQPIYATNFIDIVIPVQAQLT